MIQIRKIAVTLLFLVPFLVSAQKTCNSKKEEVLEDLNSITKCSITKSEKSDKKRSGQIRVRVSAPKKRFLKKRSKNTLNGSGVEKRSAKLLASLKLKKNLTSAEIKKAEKFTSVDEVPTFKKCSALKGDDRLDCFNKEMVKHIETHFNYPTEAVMKKLKGEVWVRFIIGKEGNVTNIKTFGPKGGKILEEEALRVVSYLPILVPGSKNGKPVSVKYGFPINFELGE